MLGRFMPVAALRSSRDVASKPLAQNVRRIASTAASGAYSRGLPHGRLFTTRAAVRNSVHYMDPNAVEQVAAKRLFDNLDASAEEAGVTIVPVMGILGGLGDILADVAAREQSGIAELTIAYTIDGWIPTRGSQLTSTLQQPAKRLAF